MSDSCPTCNASNKAVARFCFRCGDPLLRPAEPALPPEPPPAIKTPAIPCRPKRSGFDRAIILFLFGAAAFVTIQFAVRASRNYSVPPRKLAQDHATLDVGPAQNKAIYELLKARGLSVAVSELGEKLVVTASGEKIKTVDRLVHLLRRAKSSSQSRKPAQESFKRESYRLSKENAAALARVLSFTDWSIRFTHDGEMLRVVAPADDQKVIASVVMMLEGDDGD
ncbi:MAG: hypothetical protein IPK83_16435 [Planctomycetes bacterium]|nr:hypothetical protein [Planctomycetota bacterium]